MDTLLLRPPVFSLTGNVARLSTEMVFPDRIQTLWFECDAEHANNIATETSDAFFVAALLPAMRAGLTLEVEGPLSSRLYYTVSTYYMAVLRNLLPGLKKIPLRASNLTRQNWGGTGVLTPFSGGIDSFSTLIDHSAGRVPPEFEVTHLLLNNVGSHGQTARDEEIFRARIRRLKTYAHKLSLPFMAINSNLDEVFQTKYQLTHSLRNAVVGLLFQKACATYLYSSTVSYQEAKISTTYDMSFADTISLPLLSTETMKCLSSGSQRQRFEKTEQVAAHPPTYSTLDVCVSPLQAEDKTNCSKCWKCLRTQLSLEIIGALEEYEGVFDLARYRRFRWLYLCRILADNRPLAREIHREIRQHGFRVPLSARLVADIVPWALLEIISQIAEDPSRVRRKLLRMMPWLKRTAPVAPEGLTAPGTKGAALPHLAREQMTERTGRN